MTWEPSQTNEDPKEMVKLTGFYVRLNKDNCGNKLCGDANGR